MSLALATKDVVLQKDIFRFAATLYSDTCDVYSTMETQLQMIKCVFVGCDNRQMARTEIISELLDVYKYHLSENELLDIIRKSRKTFQSVMVDGDEVYCLTTEAYTQTMNAQNKSIDYYIDLFIQEHEVANKEKCKDAIHKYLYELTTTNINSYKILLNGNNKGAFFDSDVSVDINDLDEEDRLLVHDFLAWNNADKNNSLGNVVYSCLEYCLLVNGDSPNSLLKGIIKQRIIYLDTNIVFRGLGINGQSRKKVIEAFLKKCHQANLKMVILAQTKREFFDTIGTYISNIDKYPRGRALPELYESLTDHNFYSFYNEWQYTHQGLSLKYFRIHIQTMYDDFIKKFSIIDDEKIPTSITTSHLFGETRNKYSLSIQRKKQANRSDYGIDLDINPNSSHDATVIRYIELLRESQGDEKDIFLVSADKVLRSWDMSRSDIDYPVVIYPSQLFIILIKLCGRSDNDFESFVSFINIAPETPQLTAEKANIIISGISSITEDVTAQKGIVAAAYGDEFQRIVQHANTDSELYLAVQDYSKNYLETELSAAKSKLQEATKDLEDKQITIEKLQMFCEQKNEEVHKTAAHSATREKEYQSKIKKLTSEKKTQNEKIEKFAEKKTKRKYMITTYLIPIGLLLSTFFCVAFVALQFVFGDKEWNFVISLFEWIETTPFGKGNDSVMYIVDGVICAVILAAFKKWWRNPFDKVSKRKLKEELVNDYLEQNDLN